MLQGMSKYLGSRRFQTGRAHRAAAPAAVVLVALLACLPFAVAEPPCILPTIELAVDNPEERVAWSVATDGVRLAAATREDEVVLVFRRDGATWVPEARIEGPSHVGFGESVGLDGDLLVVGGSLAPGGGSVYVYRRDGASWIHDRTIRPGGAELFGRFIVLSGRRLAVMDMAPQTRFGRPKLHVLRRQDDGSWLEEALLRPPLLRTVDLGLADDTVVIGTTRTALDTVVYERSGSTWSETARLPGGARAVQSGEIFVGLEPDVLVYERGDVGWEISDTLAPPAGSNIDGFGWALAVDGDRALVGGSPFLPGGGLALYERTESGWGAGRVLATERLQSPTWSMSLSGEHAVLADTDGGILGVRLDVDCATLCRNGNVGALGGIEDVLLVNGAIGDGRREMSVAVEDRLVVTMLRPPAGGGGRFVVHANLASPSDDGVDRLGGIQGLTCFPFLAERGAAPSAIWNNIGKESRLGASRYLDGAELPDPAVAPTVILQLFHGDPVNLPAGTVMTLQGLSIDPAAVSSRPVAVTNAVVVHVE